MTETVTEGQEPLSPEKAFHRAVFWLSALIAEAEIDPDTTVVNVTAMKGGEVALAQQINLGADMRAFAALGAPIDLFADPED